MLLNTEISRLVDSLVTEGKNLYSQQKIEEALVRWRQAEKYDPENETLEELILRAEKVSKKLESLEHNQ
jgi:hypothetical protein